MSSKSILITGANGGIGQALCKKFADAGWQVFATDKQEAALVPVDQYFSLDLDRFSTDKIFREKVKRLCWHYSQTS
jgi:NAD(P)-dependent dehydrogenase (short-subunit alcohol dehydrogenase family)